MDNIFGKISSFIKCVIFLKLYLTNRIFHDILGASLEVNYIPLKRTFCAF